MKMTASRFPWTYAINPAITRTTVQFIDDGLSTAKLTLWNERIRGRAFITENGHLGIEPTTPARVEHITEYQKYQTHSRTARSTCNNRLDFTDS